MPSFKDIVEAMSATWTAALAIFIASIALIVSDHFGLTYLAALPKWVPAAAFIGAVLSGSVLAVSIIRAASDLVMAPVREKRLGKFYADHVALLEDLPQPEALLLAWAAANRTQVITAPYFNPHVKALVAKGFLEIPAGSHHTDETPFRIPAHIWKALKEEVEKDPKSVSQLVGLQPFQDRW